MLSNMLLVYRRFIWFFNASSSHPALLPNWLVDLRNSNFLSTISALLGPMSEPMAESLLPIHRPILRLDVQSFDMFHSSPTWFSWFNCLSLIEASYVTQNTGNIINTINWFYYQNPRFNNLPLFYDNNQWFYINMSYW